MANGRTGALAFLQFLVTNCPAQGGKQATAMRPALLQALRQVYDSEDYS